MYFETNGTLNSEGLYSKEHEKNKDPNTTRIALLGDSFTFGYGLPINETIARFLEQDIKIKTDKQIEVINFGLPGLSSRSIYQSYHKQVKEYEPDIIIMNYFANDPESCYINNTRLTFFYLIKDKILNFKSFYNTAGEFGKYAYKLHTSLNPCYKDNYNYIRKLNEDIKKEEGDFILVFLGFNSEDIIVNKIHEKIKRFAKQENIFFVSTKDEILEQGDAVSSLHLKNAHFTILANKIIAKKIAKEILRNGFID
jgi:hypothetical protein